MRYLLTLIGLLSTLTLTPAPLQAKGVKREKIKHAVHPDQVLDESGVDFNLDAQTRVNVRVNKNKFELYFIDEKRVPIKPKYQKARLLFMPLRPRRSSQRKITLILSPATQGEFPCLRANKVVRPPHNGKILATLLGGGGNKPLGMAQFRSSAKEEASDKN